MNIRKKLALPLLALLLQLSPSVLGRESQPNVIFLLVDDLGWSDLGSYGSTFHESPNIDQLAASGVRFTNAYSSASICSPSRASIMSGKAPPRVNITDWIPGHVHRFNLSEKLNQPAIRADLDLSEVTIAESLKAAGYKTFFAGKWHLGGEGALPQDQGFDENQGGHHYGEPPAKYYSPYKIEGFKEGPRGEYLTDRLTDESIAFLEESSDSPFLLYLSFYNVHTPIQGSLKHVRRFHEKASSSLHPGPRYRVEREGLTKVTQDNADYASMIYALDENIGRLLTKVDELGLNDNTVIIFTSDNGGRSTRTEGVRPTSNLPLRAGKGWLYEGGIRVPLIVRAPGVTDPGSVSDALVAGTDFYPTILELADLPLAPDQHIDGMSFLPALKGEEGSRKDLYWHYPHYHASGWSPGAAIRSGPWKLIELYDKEAVELFNLAADQGEEQDLSAQEPEIAASLLRKLHSWQATVGAKANTVNTSYSPSRDTDM